MNSPMGKWPEDRDLARGGSSCFFVGWHSYGPMGTGPQQLLPWHLILGLTVLLALPSDGSQARRLMPWSRPGLAQKPCS